MRHASILLIAIACSFAAHAAPPPAEAYGRLPAIGDASISPDGKRVALSVGFEYVAAEPDRELTAFRILNIDTGTVEHTLAPPPRHTLRGVHWADEQRPYYFISTTADAADTLPSSMPLLFRGTRIEFWRTSVFSLEKKSVAVLMDNAEHRMNPGLTNLLAPIDGDPGFGRMIAYGGAASFNSDSRLAIYRVNLDSGGATLQTTGDLGTRGYLLDERGGIVARVDVNDRTNYWRITTYDGGKEKVLKEGVSERGEPIQIHGLLDDGRLAAVDAHKEGDRGEIIAIDRVTGETSTLHKTEGSDVGAIQDPWRHRVVGVGWIDDLPKQHFFDAKLQEIYGTLQTYFADGYVVLTSWSRDRNRVLVFGERPNDAGTYYVYDVAANKLRSVGKRYPALGSPESLGDRRAIRFNARDGKSVPAYLTLPAGVEATKLPLVLLVHGGPHARDTFMFDWWSSFLASRGYAVLQVNYRGSTGYGYEWFDAGRGGWGDGVMQTDVEDGADALVKSGMVDPARICIMGGSYGGYAALAGATLTPDRYACAVSVNGVTDLERMRKDVESSRLGRRAPVAEWWRKSMGEDIHKLRRISPIENVDKVRTAVLLVHGVDDTVVPVEQSRSMNTKLKRADKDVRYVELRGDDHWLSSASTRTTMLQEVEAFLRERLRR